MLRTPYDETLFWSTQFSEHLQFLAMLFTDAAAIREAGRLKIDYDKARTQALSSGPRAAEVIHPAHQRVRAWQGAMVVRLAAGEFLGWAFPLFLEHITREMDLYSHLVYGTVAPSGGVDAAVKQLGAEHAQFAAHLLDPTEVALVDRANVAADSLFALVDDPSSNVAAAKGERAIIDFLTTNRISLPGGALSIIPKALTDHVIREQYYFADTLERG